MLSSGARRILVRNVLSRARTPSRLLGERPPSIVRYLSAQQKEGDTDRETEESLKDTVRKMRQDDESKSTGEDDEMNEKIDDFMRSAKGTWATFTEEVGKTWGDLLKSGERKSINKQIRHPEDTVEGEAEYTGSVAIMVIDESENLTAWERMQKRLTEAPIISGKYHQVFVLRMRYTLYD